MNSAQAFQQAKMVIPGGVNSPVRAYKSVGGTPLFIKKAYAAYVEDIEGRRYIDYVASYGPMINGHAHPAVIEAVQSALKDGLSFGAPTLNETALAEKICQRIDNVEMIRMCNSGTEATMSAIRLARAATGRDNIIKFTGCYHGHSDGLLVAAGSGALTFGVPDSPGVPADFAKHTLLARYNHLSDVSALFSTHGDEIAAVIVEPVAGNMNCVPPSIEFLQGLRDLTQQYGALLIFDEVMTGFRVAHAGAQELYGIKADLVTYGKVIGGGMPVGAFAGSQALMNLLSPVGGVYQAGTLSGNPVAMAAGIANLALTEDVDFYRILDHKTQILVKGIQSAAEKYQIPLVVNSVCGMIGCFFTDLDAVNNFEEAQSVDVALFAKFFHLMLEQGIYLAPSPFETIFMSMAHTNEDIQQTLHAFEQVFSQLNGQV